MSSFDVERSWATEPFCYEAPHPPQVTPLPYQHAAVEYALDRPHALFGDVPGLGKTVEALLLGNALGCERTLVVCPASLRLNWEREIWRWSILPNVSTYPVQKSSDGVSHRHNYVIISYALLSNPTILDAVCAVKWDHIICDEAHMLKDPSGNKRTQAVFNHLPEVAGRFTFMSGTIAPNQPIEVYNACRLLCWEAIDRMSLDRFRQAYYDFGGGMVRGPVFNAERQVWENKLHWSLKVRNVPKNLDDLQYRLRSNFMIRRTKALVLPQLPPVRWMPVPLQSTAAIREALRHPGWKAAEQLYSLDQDAFNHGVPVDGHISAARKALGIAKVKPVAEYAKDVLEGGVEKLVVSAHHIDVLHHLRLALEPYGLVYMDGSTTMGARQRAVDTFQADAGTRIILGQTQVIGEGHTLAAAQDVLLAEPDWVPGRNQQMVDRIHRIGQKGSYVLAHIPVVPGTLDEKVLGTVIAKDQHLHLLLDKR